MAFRCVGKKHEVALKKESHSTTLQSSLLFSSIKKYGILFAFASLITFFGMHCNSPTDSTVAPSNLHYSKDTSWYIPGTSIAIAAPKSSGSAVKSYSITPALPTELNFDATTGAITGTLTTALATATYTVTASNTAGSTTCHLTFSITSLIVAAPVGGESYSFTQTIPVKWTVNPDSIATNPIGSFAHQFSLDSGLNWVNTTYDPATAIHVEGMSDYLLNWIGLDTTQVNPITFQPLTKADFLNKGVLIRIVSYGERGRTRLSGYIFFHE
jgi:hypothetical protein